MAYQTVRALRPIRHLGVLHIPGQTTGDHAQDFVVNDNQAAALVSAGAATSLGVADAPVTSRQIKAIYGQYRGDDLEAVRDEDGRDFPGGSGGGSDGSVVGLIPNSPSASATNAALIQAALNGASGQVAVNSAGIVWCDPVYVPSRKRFVVGKRANLRRSDNANAPLIQNEFGARLTRATNLVRSGSTVTVQERFHNKQVGQVVHIAGATNASMNGDVTVASKTAHAWTYTKAGTSGVGGGATDYVSIIPMRRNLAGAALVRSGNLVTVSDVGHDLDVGQEVFVAAASAATFAGMAEVAAVTDDSWSYYKAGADGAASGAVYLSYDSDIEVIALGTIDGNRATNGDTTESDNCCSVVVFGATSNYKVRGRVGGTPMRAINSNNCSDADISIKMFDCLVGVQYEGSAKRTLTHRMRGSNVSLGATHLSDDIVAYTGTRQIGGEVYDSTVSPYGLGLFVDNTVDNVQSNTSVNGIKLTFDPLCFVDNVKIRNVSGKLTDPTATPGMAAGVRITDDTLGLLGMRVGRLTIDGVRWAGGAGAAVQFSSQGTIDTLECADLHALPADGQTGNFGFLFNAYGNASNAGRIKKLVLSNIDWVAQGGSIPGVLLGSAVAEGANILTIDHLVLRDFRMQPGGDYGAGAAFKKYGNCKIGHIEVVSGVFEAPPTGVGTPVAICGPATVGKLSFTGVDVVPNVSNSNEMGWGFLIENSDLSVAALSVVLTNSRLRTFSGVSNGGSVMSGAMDFSLVGSSWTSVANNFIQFDSGTLTITVAADEASFITPDKVVLAAFTGSLRARGNLKLDGNKVNAAQPGDSFWNTNAAMTGSASIGRKGRTNANAWVSLY